MWDRRILKSNAKVAIGGGKYWLAAGVVLVVTLFPMVVMWASGFDRTMDAYMEALQNAMYYNAPTPNPGPMQMYSLGFGLFNILVLLPLSVGLCSFFIRNRFDAQRFGDLFAGFQGNYFNTVKTLFVTDLIITLWSLLLVIPGIIKSLQYSMVVYLLSDNPNLPSKRARQISRMMTDGEKGAIFVLILSFLGWMLLPVVLGVIVGMAIPLLPWLSSVVTMAGTILIMPYYYATFVELYLYLRDRAIQTGMVQPEELGL